MKNNFSSFRRFYFTKKSLSRLLTEIMTVILIICTVTVTVIKTDPAVPGPDINVLSKLGSRSDEVRRVQSTLKNLGYYSGAVDGIFGLKTQTAVKNFQKNCGLTVDGIAGPKTLLYLGLGSVSYTSGYSSSDSELLAKLIEAEARGESYTGQVAVGAVVLNRVESSSFPDTVSGVIYQSGAFSAVRDSNWRVSPSATSRKAALDAINGWDPTGGSLYYYNPAKTSNAWIRTRPVVTVIGNHVFCK